jgi:hypothetical protein
MRISIHPLKILFGALVLFGSMSAYTSDFWARPTPLPPESMRLADTWSSAPGR